MEKLKGQLTKELQQDINVKIMQTSVWNLPVHSLEIAFDTVMRTKMDILMKMILITFQKTTIETVEELSEILLVEPLFIRDLINKLSRSGIIEKRKKSFVLTATGIQQLEAGILEHEPKSRKEIIRYSPCHSSFFDAEEKELSEAEEEIYRFKQDIDIRSLEESFIIEGLKGKGIESIDGNIQIVVSEIHSVSERRMEQMPCIEFHLYNQAEDLLYARVWNTLSDQWDDTLEAQIEEKERKHWRERYLLRKAHL